MSETNDEKRIGRPPLHEGITRGRPIKIDLGLYSRVQSRVGQTYRTVTGEINQLLEWALENIKDEKEKGGSDE